MRTGTSDILSQGHSGRLRLNARLRRARKSRNYRIDLEGLESRTLLATIPAATPTTAAPTDISSLMGNVGGVNASESSSTVAVDPLDPSKLVAVWIDNDPTMFADHGQRPLSRSWRRRIRPTAARSGTCSWPSRSIGSGIECPHSAQPRDVWADASLSNTCQVPAWGLTTAATFTS